MSNPLATDTAGRETGLAPGSWARSLDQELGLAQRIADQLAEAIIQGELTSGARLNEVELATAFGISRTPVREALFILERDQLVERQPRRGARVAPVSAKQAQDVYVCRAYLYGLSAHIGATRLSDGDLERLASIVDEMSAAVAASEPREYYRLNIVFHELVAQSTGNDMLLRLMDNMGRHTLRFRYMSVTIPGRMQESFDAHRELLAALRSRSGERAEGIVRRIISEAGDAVLRHFFGVDTNPVAAEILHL